MRQRVTVTIEDLDESPKTWKYIFPNVEGFEVSTWNDYHYYNDSMNFNFKGEAWGNKDGIYVRLEESR